MTDRPFSNENPKKIRLHDTFCRLENWSSNNNLANNKNNNAKVQQKCHNETKDKKELKQ